MSDDQRNALPTGHELQNYRLEAILGSGGFGITYRAVEAFTDRRVAIKEYLPAGIATRDRDSMAVHPISNRDRADYDWGLDRFRQEAKVLIALQHPSIVPVLNYFEANGTGYLVMVYQDGRGLDRLLNPDGTLTQEELDELLPPMLDGLALVHAAGYLHRDIKPANIYIRQDGSPVLLDFGAARQALGQQSKSLTAIVSEGYAPYEQYEAAGNQGPWTDLYGLGAVLYRCVTGQRPPDAPSRLSARVKGTADPLAPLAGAAAPAGYRPEFLQAIDYALRPLETERPQSVADFRRILSGAPIPAASSPHAPFATPPAAGAATMLAGDAGGGRGGTEGGTVGGTPAPPPEGTPQIPPKTPPETPPPGRRRVAPLVAGGLAALLLLGGAAGAFVMWGGDERASLEKTRLAEETLAEERRAAEEARRKAEEEAAREREREEAERKFRDERARAAEEERRREEEARRRREEAARKHAEDEKRAREEAEARKRAEDARARRDAEEAQKRREAEEARKRREAEAAGRREAAEAEARKEAEEARARARREAEEAQREAEEARRKAEEARRRAGSGGYGSGGDRGRDRDRDGGRDRADARERAPDGAAGLRAALTGTSFTVQLPKQSTRVTFVAGGQLRGNRAEEFGGGQISTTDHSNDTGTWSIEGNRLCTQWRIWDQGRNVCYTVQAVDAAAGVYRLTGGGFMSGQYRLAR